MKPYVTIAMLAGLATASPVVGQSAQQRPAPAAVQTFTVNIVLSPAVQAHARKVRQGVRVIAGYSGAAKPRYADYEAESGALEFGNDEFAVPAVGGTLTFGRGMNRRDLHMLQGPLEVSLQVIVGAYPIFDTFPGPNQNSDNLLVCTGYGRVTDKVVKARFNDLAGIPKTLNCNMPKGKFAVIPPAR